MRRTPAIGIEPDAGKLIEHSGERRGGLQPG